MNRQQILEQIVNHYGEWIETAGVHAPYLIQNILADCLIKEKQKTKYLENRIKSYELNVEGVK